MRTPSRAPPVANHLEEARVVPRRREEARPAGEVPARTLDVVPLTPGPFRRPHDRPVRAARVHRRPAARARVRRQEEPGVLHAEWRRDPLGDEPIERHPRCALDDAAEDVGVVSVNVRVARLGDEGKGGQPFHRVADAFVLVRGVPAESSRQPGLSPRRGPPPCCRCRTRCRRCESVNRES